MDGLLGNNGTLGSAIDEIAKTLNPATQDTLANKISEAIKNVPNQAFDFSAEYTKFSDAITASTDIIDEALNSNDLTELDTTNLKAVRSYLTETLATVDAAIKDSGLNKTATNQAGTIKKEQLEKIQEGLNSNISKAVMEELLGKDGTGGTIKTQLDAITKALDATDGIQKLVDDAAKANQAGALDISAKFTALKDAVTAANKAIDEKLESGDLTQLDTSNLKALRSSINNIQNQVQSAFDDVSLDTSKNNTNVDPAKAKELQEALKNGVVASNTELGEKAGGVATSSQNQAQRRRWRSYWGKMELQVI